MTAAKKTATAAKAVKRAPSASNKTKTAAKKTTARKAATKKTSVPSRATRKAPSKRTAAKKAAAPRAAAKKAAAKRPSGQRAATSGSSAARRRPANKTTGTAKRTTRTSTAATKKVTTRKATVKKTTTARATPKKTTAKAAPRQTTSRKPNASGLSAPSISAMRKEAFASFWVKVGAVPGAEAYEVQAARDKSFTTDTHSRVIKRTGEETWLSGLTDGQQYFYRGRALKGSAAGPWSRVASKQLTAYGISEPASEIVAVGDEDFIYVTWLAAVSRSPRPLTYRIEMATDRAMENVVESITTHDCQARFTPKSADLHYFRVYTSNDGERERADATRYADRTEASLVVGDAAGAMKVAGISPYGMSAHWPHPGPAAGHVVVVSKTPPTKAGKFGKVIGQYAGYPGHRRLSINELEPEQTYWVANLDHNGEPRGVAEAFTTRPEGTSLRIGTYNVRFVDLDGPKSAHSWAKRREAVADIIAPNFDVIGVQEAATWPKSRKYRGRTQRDDLLHLIKARNSDFAAIDTRVPSSGVHVFYRPSLLRPTTPAKHVRWQVGGQNRGQALIAKFEDVEHGTPLVYVSVHLSPFISHPERVAHSLDLAHHIYEESYGGLYPVVVVGDFNSHAARTNDTPKTVLTDHYRSGLTLYDAEEWQPGRPRTLIHSANTDWRPTIIDTAGHKTDYVLADERISVLGWDYVKTWTERGVLSIPQPSDHHAIWAVAVLPR